MSIMEQKMQEQIEASLEMQADMQQKGIMSVNDMIRLNCDADEEDRLNRLFDIEALSRDAVISVNVEKGDTVAWEHDERLYGEVVELLSNEFVDMVRFKTTSGEIKEMLLDEAVLKKRTANKGVNGD